MTAGRAPLVIITGPPGAGKTTLCRTFAAESDDGLHLESDLFYRFPGRPIDPSLPASHAQNRAIVRALGAAAASFVSDGYRVYLDGIIGPWFLETLRGALTTVAENGQFEIDPFEIDYVVLDLPADEALARVRARDGEDATTAAGRMHAAFRDLGALATHRFPVTGLTLSRLGTEVGEGLDAGRFRLR